MFIAQDDGVVSSDGMVPTDGQDSFMRINNMASKRSIKMAQLYGWLLKTGHQYRGISDGIGREAIADRDLNLIEGSEDWVDDVVQGKLQARQIHKALAEGVSPYDIAAQADARRLKQRNFECDWSLEGIVRMSVEIMDPRCSAADVRKLIRETDRPLEVVCQHGDDGADEWYVKNDNGEIVATVQMGVTATLQPKRKAKQS